jgi:pSer/pThr/pTyr-binding forkhead associated (FHA) protein
VTTAARCDHCAHPLVPGNSYCQHCGAVVGTWATPAGDPGPSAKAFLLVQFPNGVVRKEALTRPVIRVGRGKDCDVLVDHPRVSRIHALLELQDGGYNLSDARSSGGTFLRDGPVHEPTRLKSGDSIRLGRVEEEAVILVYHEEA